MESELVTISREEYELLITCRHVVESEFEERFSQQFIQAVKVSEEAFKRGDTVKVKTSQERRMLFASL